MKVIGLSGFARAGKDEVAKILVEQHGFKRVAFADKLRDFLYALNPQISVWQQWDSEPGRVTVQDAIDRYGWDTYKETMYKDEIRRLLQRLGTEAGRQTLWDSIWIDAAFAGIPEDAKVVVSDARFLNEFDAITSRGGQVWRINRPGVGALNAHASETEALQYKDFAKYINNDGSLAELAGKVAVALNDRQVEQHNRGGVITYGMTTGG